MCLVGRQEGRKEEREEQDIKTVIKRLKMEREKQGCPSHLTASLRSSLGDPSTTNRLLPWG